MMPTLAAQAAAVAPVFSVFGFVEAIQIMKRKDENSLWHSAESASRVRCATVFYQTLDRIEPRSR